MIVDYFNKKAWCIPLKKKSDTATAIKEWVALHDNEAGKRIKKMRSDNKGEYIGTGVSRELNNQLQRSRWSRWPTFPTGRQSAV